MLTYLFVKMKFLFISFLTISLSDCLNTFLNVDEVNSIHYDVDILNKPVLKDQNWEQEVVTMVNKHGQEYICKLPEVFTSQTNNKKDENILDQLTDISELLKPMEAAPCLVKTKDWWTYEFCYGSVIKQYHLEDNKVTGPILILGKYESEYNWKNSSETKNRLQRFHSQFYVNGTKCDITVEPRRAEVRFHCEDSMGDSIQRVDEPESCRYVVTVATTRVCHHPYLRPHTSSTPHTISCHPALTSDQYDRYNKQQQLKLLKAEKELKIATEIADDDISVDSKGSESEDLKEDNDNVKWSRAYFSLIRNRKNNQKDFIEDGSFIKNLLAKQDGNRHTERTTSNPQGGKDSDMMTEDRESSDIKNDEPSPQSTDTDNDGDTLDNIDLPKDKDVSKLDDNPDFTAKEILDAFFHEEDEVDGIDDEEYDLEEDPPRREEVNRQLAALKLKLEKLMMDNSVGGQNSYDLEEFLEKMSDDLEESLRVLLKKAPLTGDESLSQLVKEVIKMADKFKDQDNNNEEDQDNDFNEERFNVLLATFAKTLEETEAEVLAAKQKMVSFERYLDKQLKEIQENGADVSSDDSPVPSGSRSQKSPLDPTSPDPTSDMPKAGLSSDQKLTKTVSSTRQLRILNEKSLDEPHKKKLEKSIRERLQKSGLDNIGRKIEVKILTPNYLDDDERHPLPTLTKEETETFQNMIVNILSKNAEELDEREKHKTLEKNYNFRLEDLESDPLLEDDPEEEGD